MQSVENLFDLAFLVRDGHAKIEIDPETQRAIMGEFLFDCFVSIDYFKKG
jgi:hypothetical protein